MSRLAPRAVARLLGPLLGLLAAACGDGGGGASPPADDAGAGGGGCGACAPAHATGACVDDRCVVARCDDGFIDADGDAANGCECAPAGDEVCDGVDQDCDGVVDEGLEGDACSECGAAACADGVAACLEAPADAAAVVLTDTGLALAVESSAAPAVGVGPDGALYIGAAGTPPRLWRVAADGGAAEPVPVDHDARGDRPAVACGATGCTFAWWRADGQRPGIYFLPVSGGAPSFRGLGTDHEPGHDRAWLSVVGGEPLALVRFTHSGRVDVLAVPLDEAAAPRVLLTRLTLGRVRLVAGGAGLLEQTAGDGLAFYPDAGGDARVRDPVWTVADALDPVTFEEGGDLRLVWRGSQAPRLRTARLAADGAVVEAPRGEDWPIASLVGADAGASAWLAGQGLGAAGTVRYRRLATNGAWLPAAELAGEGVVGGVALAAGGGAVWGVYSVRLGGESTLRVARFGGGVCP